MGRQFITASSEDASKYGNKIISYKIEHGLIKVHKIKIFACLQKIKDVRHWEKLFASYTPGKRLIDVLCKEFLDIIKKTKNKSNLFKKVHE